MLGGAEDQRQDTEHQDQTAKGVRVLFQKDVTPFCGGEASAARMPGQGGPRARLFVDAGFQHPDVRQLAVFLVVVQAAAHHEGVWDGEAHIVGFQRPCPPLGLIQQDTQLQGGGWRP